MVTGRCYQSNKKSYHQIRYQSDKLCKENSLSVIDEFYERYKKKYKINGKSWYENEQAKHGTSWKSKLHFDKDPINLYIEPIFSLIPCKRGIIAVPIPSSNVINAESHMLSFFSIKSF